MPNYQDWSALMQMLQKQMQAQRGMGYPGMPSLPQLPGMGNAGPQTGGGQWRPPPSTAAPIMPQTGGQWRPPPSTAPTMPLGGLPGGMPGGMPGMPGGGQMPGQPQSRPWQAPLPGFNPPAGPPAGLGQPGTMPPPGWANGPQPGGISVVGNMGRGGVPGGLPQGPTSPEAMQRILQQLLGAAPSGTSMPSGSTGLPGDYHLPQMQPAWLEFAQQSPQGFQAMIERLRQMYMGMPQGSQTDLFGRPITGAA